MLFMCKLAYIFCLMAFCLNKPCVSGLQKYNAANSLFTVAFQEFVFTIEASEGVHN